MDCSSWHTLGWGGGGGLESIPGHPRDTAPARVESPPPEEDFLSINPVFVLSLPSREAIKEDTSGSLILGLDQLARDVHATLRKKRQRTNEAGDAGYIRLGMVSFQNANLPALCSPVVYGHKCDDDLQQSSRSCLNVLIRCDFHMHGRLLWRKNSKREGLHANG